MHRYQVWVTCAILLAFAPLSGLYGKQIQSSYDDTRYLYSEDLSTLSNLDYLEDTHLDTTKNRLTLQLDDHIAQQAPVVVGRPADSLASGARNNSEYVYVVWHDLRNDAGDIYAQKLDSDGMRMWPADIKVNDDSEEATQSAPAAAVNSDGDLWVVWVDNRNEGDNDIYAQGLDSNGDRIWDTDRPVNQNGDGANQGEPAVALDDNTLIVVWHDNRDDNDFDIYTKKIGLGNIVRQPTDEQRLNAEANGPQTSPSIGVGDGNVIVAWLDQRIGNGDIYAQKISDDGGPFWDNDIRINQPAYGTQKPPSLVMKSDGQAIVSWLSSAEAGNRVYMSEINGEISGADILISGEQTANFGVQPAATLVGNDNIAIGWKQISDGNLHINIRDTVSPHSFVANGKIDQENREGTGNRSEMLSLAALNDKEVFAVWVDTRDGRKTDIYGQKLDLEGNAAWAQARFINDSSGQIDQQNPAVAVDSAGNSIVAWYSERGGQSNLFLQKFSSDGDPEWTQQIPVSDTSIQGQSLVPDLAALGNDILITWADRQTGVSRIYAQRFDSEGNRVWNSDQPASKDIDSRQETVEQFNPQIVAGDIFFGFLDGESINVLFVAWQEYSETTSQIVFQRLDDEGQPFWEKDKIIEPVGGSLSSPTLAFANEQIAIAWISTSGGETDLYLQAYNMEGAASTERIQINQFDGLVDQINPPALAADQSGNLIAVWVDRRASAIYARGYQSNAQPSWAPIKLNQVPGSFSPNPDIAAVPNSNETVVVWQGMNQGELSVYAQRLDIGGSSGWALDTSDAEKAILVSENSENAWLPAVAVDNSGNSTIVWREERNMNQDIYLQRLNNAGEHMLSDGVVDVAVVDVDKFYRSKGFVQSKEINSTGEPIQKALLTYQGVLNSGQITFTLTNDGGESWESVQPGVMHSFKITTTGYDDLRWQAHLQQPNVANLSLSPAIDEIQIDYTIVPSDTVSSEPGDVYEVDNVCDQAWPIQSDGVNQERTLHASDAIKDEDWISFQTDTNTQYILMVTPKDNPSVDQMDLSDLQVKIYNDCSRFPLAKIEAIPLKVGMPDKPAHFYLTLSSGKYHARIARSYQTNQNIDYQFSIRPVPNEGRAIIVAGVHSSLQDKVDQSASRAKNTLLAYGFGPENVYHLQGAMGPDNDVNSETLRDKLKGAIQDLVIESNVSPVSPLLLYLVGRGKTNTFYLNDNEPLTVDELDLWLSNLENSSKVGTRSNRVLITGIGGVRGIVEDASNGFLFSDTFWLAMSQGHSIRQSFDVSNRKVEELGVLCPRSAECQKPVLDDSSDGWAYRYGLNVSSQSTVPTIQHIDISRNLSGTPLTIEVAILDSAQIGEVKARIRPASDSLSDQADDILGSLTRNSGSNRYSGQLRPIPKDDNYLITFYGWDGDLIILPRTIEHFIRSRHYFFPFISK